MGTEFVRVKDPGTKHEVTVPAAFAKANKLEPLTDKAAVDDNGRPLPGKPYVELAKADNSTDGAAGSGTPETDPATSSTTSGQTAGKAATK